MASLFPTLVIGLGGTGHRTVRQIKRIIAEALVELEWPSGDSRDALDFVRSVWQFLVFDTTAQDVALFGEREVVSPFTESGWISRDDYCHLGANLRSGDYLTAVGLSKLGSDEFQRRFPDLAEGLQVPDHLRPYSVAPGVRRQAAQFFAHVYRQSIRDDLEKRIGMMVRDSESAAKHLLQRMMGIPDELTDEKGPIRIFIVGSSAGATGSVLMLEILGLVREAYRTVCDADCFPSLVVFPADAFEIVYLKTGHSENEEKFLSRLESLYQFGTPADKRPYDIYFLPHASSSEQVRWSTRSTDGSEAIMVASEHIASLSMRPFSEFDFFRQEWPAKRLQSYQPATTVLVSSFGFVKLAIGRRHLANYLKELLVGRLVETSDGGTPDHFTKVLANLSAPIPLRLLPLEHEYLLEGPELWPELARMLLEQSCTQPVTTTANLLDAVSREIIEGGFPISNPTADIAPPLELTGRLSLDLIDRQVRSWLMRPGSVTQQYLKEGLRSFLHGDLISRDVLETRSRAFREKLEQALAFTRADEHYWRNRVRPETSPTFVRWTSPLPEGLPPEIMNNIIDLVRNYLYYEFRIIQRSSDTESISFYKILNTLATPKPPIGLRNI